MPLTYLGIGTNLGDRESNLNKAMILLRKYVGDIYNISSFYTFKPWGFISENDFSNAAVLVNTELSPSRLLEAIKGIEKEMGRISTTKGIYEDRIIDIDILLYDNRIINEQNLIIPHPNMEKREFVLVPLSEIAPGLVHPVTHKTILHMRNELKID